jgi:hypothetical protein
VSLLRIKAISQVFDMWLFDLHEIGVDLAQYGAREKALHLTGTVDNVFIYQCREEICLKLAEFSYGPLVRDWHFLVLRFCHRLLSIDGKSFGYSKFRTGHSRVVG